MTGARRHVVERLLSWSAADHHFCEIYIRKRTPWGPFSLRGDQAGSSVLWAEAVCSLATGSRRLMYFQSASSM